ncbi:hypothetical protein L0664_12655 [Octadecabacter sp. G9-8]|uniref:Leucine-rich repeat domain-containing protein n=1 Tax=Octadecabacter dasysiphoniae TaxID=2909341 RepID=A0ABS9D0J9_9RHOB|nr:hypothetical protein [Octadecabacter dasysiphoniae]MCF2871921.1 hypothetical protein [Octadecabacter dasysiphoniae]
MSFRFLLPTTAIAFLIGCQPAINAASPAEQRILATEAKLTDCIMERCKLLNIDRGDLDDFSMLADLDHVQALRMSWTDFLDLNDIAPMTQLRELHISSTQVSDLSGLAAFENLDILHLQWSTEASDLSPIGNLTPLTELALGGNSVGDMDFVASLINLDGLSLTSSKISSMAALIGHPSLSRLDLEMAQLPEDISALLTIPNLRVVSITPTRLTDRQMVVVDALRAKGVQVDEIPEVVVVIC